MSVITQAKRLPTFMEFVIIFTSTQEPTIRIYPEDELSPHPHPLSSNARQGVPNGIKKDSVSSEKLVFTLNPVQISQHILHLPHL
jgi:hypothetical protein